MPLELALYWREDRLGEGPGVAKLNVNRIKVGSIHQVKPTSAGRQPGESVRLRFVGRPDSSSSTKFPSGEADGLSGMGPR